MLYESTGITEDKIIHACWENAGYAAPGTASFFSLFQERVCFFILLENGGYAAPGTASFFSPSQERVF
jgi:hypothetical protein